MILSDREIRTGIEGKWIGHEPFDPALINPASMDMRLADVIRVPRGVGHSHFAFPEIDTWAVREDHTYPWYIPADGYVLKPHGFILASTAETVTLPDDIVARVEGKSSIGRIGLAVHITAGFIDPGFCGQVTLEIANLAPWPIRLHAGMRIAQIAYQRMHEPSERPYGEVGHYQGQEGPVESRFRMS